jgi:hypothetical protein
MTWLPGQFGSNRKCIPEIPNLGLKGLTLVTAVTAATVTCPCVPAKRAIPTDAVKFVF